MLLWENTGFPHWLGPGYGKGGEGRGVKAAFGFLSRWSHPSTRPGSTCRGPACGGRRVYVLEFPMAHLDEIPIPDTRYLGLEFSRKSDVKIKTLGSAAYWRPWERIMETRGNHTAFEEQGENKTPRHRQGCPTCGPARDGCEGGPTPSRKFTSNIVRFCDYTSMYLMCGPRQLFFQCGPGTSKCRAPLVKRNPLLATLMENIKFLSMGRKYVVNNFSSLL